MRSDHAHERLDCSAEVAVHGVVHKWVERPAEACLPDELERSAAHPIEDVNLLLPVLDPPRERFLQLLGDIGEDGEHVPHVRDAEDRVEQPSLPPVPPAQGREEAVAQHTVELPVVG